MSRKSKEKCSAKRMFRGFLPVTGTICLVIVSFLCILFRIRSNKLHDEKWKEYENCGI